MSQDLVEEITTLFRENGMEQPDFEARRLVDESESPEQAREWAKRRLTGEPLAYLSGTKGFYKYEFSVQPGVLVPRPESEHVVEVALKRKPTATRIADLGCGSGCIGLSLASDLEDAELCAVDSSPLACEVTAQNAEDLALDERVKVINKDVLNYSPLKPFDLIVANPPYIATGDKSVQKSVDQFEPHAALYSGVDGLDALRAWVPWAYKYLTAGGVFVTEIGTGQSPKVSAIMTAAGFTAVEVANDLAGHDRVVSAIKK